MKVTAQLLRSRAGKPLRKCQHLDLSGQKIVKLDKLHLCPNVTSIDLNGNFIEIVENLDVLPQLWSLNLANNRIQNLDGLQMFVAMGTLILSNNDISWSEVSRLKRMHILDISLHGNPQLEKDPHYRIHVIDCLPNVWMLDGKIVTSAERLQVQHFFQDSALTEIPIRRKVGKKSFTPSALKKIEVHGIYGNRTSHLMMRFPTSGPLNIDTDKKRLRYLAYTMQEDILLAEKLRKRKTTANESKCFLEELLEERLKDRVQCNMLLIILVSSLEFALPAKLVRELLQRAGLELLGKTPTMDLFLLPRETRCRIACLLLSAVKVDKDIGEDGGLYDKLYLCLYQSVSELSKLSHSNLSDSQNSGRSIHCRSESYRDAQCLIASEVVQLLCVVPEFFDYLTKDRGIQNLVSVATSDPLVIDKIEKEMSRLSDIQCSERRICEEITKIILNKTDQNAMNIICKKTIKNSALDDNYILDTSKAIPRRLLSFSIQASEFHASGRTSPDKNHVRLKTGKSDRRRYIPIARLGEKVLLGPQTLGRIILAPEPELVLVQMDSVPAASGAMIQNSSNCEEHYTYLDMTQLYWDHLGGYWRPKGTVGDRVTIQRLNEEAAAAVGPQTTRARATQQHGDAGQPRLETGCHLAEEHVVRPQRKGSLAQYDSEDDEVRPIPVSARFKEEHNLSLQWPADGHAAAPGSGLDGVRHSASLTAIAPPRNAEPNVNDVAEASGNAGEECVGVRSLVSVITDLECRTKVDNETLDTTTEGPVDGLYARMQTAIHNVFHVQIEGSDRERFEDSTCRGAVSRSSSFESIDEPELKNINLDSRPVTGKKTRLMHPLEVAESAQSNTPSAPSPHVEVPQITEYPDPDVIDDPDKVTDVLTGMVNTIKSPRGGQVCGLDTSGLVVPKDPRRVFTSPYQCRRIDAWKAAGANPSEGYPPPQRPSSPTRARGENNLSGAATRLKLNVQQCSRWMAGGKDVYWETVQSRPPRAGLVPGWKEGLPDRPKSAAALRASKRTKAPTVATPSSLAYEYLYAPKGSSSPRQAGPPPQQVDECRPRTAGALRTGIEILPGSKLESHPYAKQQYQQRQSLQVALLCGTCLARYRHQERELVEQLGEANQDLIGQLLNLESCDHRQPSRDHRQPSRDHRQASCDHRQPSCDHRQPAIGQRLPHIEELQLA